MISIEYGTDGCAYIYDEDHSLIATFANKYLTEAENFVKEINKVVKVYRGYKIVYDKGEYEVLNIAAGRRFFSPYLASAFAYIDSVMSIQS